MWCVWLEDSGARVALGRMVQTILPGTWTGSLGRVRNRQLGRKPMALPGDQWVRVRNTLGGLGEIDIGLARGRDRAGIDAALAREQRRFLGREVVGRVVETGADVTLVQTGDRVTLIGPAQASCATLNLQPPCQACAGGNVSLCEHRAVPWAGTGAGWSDEMIVHESQLFLVPAALTDDQAVLLEPAARAVRAVLYRLPDPGAQVLIIGGAMQGIFLLAAIKALAPGAVVTYATDAPHEQKLAQDLGCQSIISAHIGTLLAQGALLTNAQTFQRGGAPYLLGGYSIIYDCLATSASIATAVRLAHSGGLVVIAGMPQGEVRLDATLVQRDEVSLVGIAGAGMERVPEDVKDGKAGRWSSLAVAARLMRKGLFKTEGMISHRLPARRLRQGLRLAGESSRNGVARAILTFD